MTLFLLLALWFVPVTLMAVGLIMMRYWLYRRQRAEDEAMAERGFEPVMGVSGGMA